MASAGAPPVLIAGGGIGGLAGAGLGYGLSRLFTDMLGGTISSLPLRRVRRSTRRLTCTD